MNTQTETSPLVGLYVSQYEYCPFPWTADTNILSLSCVTFGLMATAVGPMIVLVNSTPDRIPADVIADEQERAEEKIADGRV